MRMNASLEKEHRQKTQARSPPTSRGMFKLTALLVCPLILIFRIKTMGTIYWALLRGHRWHYHDSPKSE